MRYWGARCSFIMLEHGFVCQGHDGHMLGQRFPSLRCQSEACIFHSCIWSNLHISSEEVYLLFSTTWDSVFQGVKEKNKRTQGLAAQAQLFDPMIGLKLLTRIPWLGELLHPITSDHPFCFPWNNISDRRVFEFCDWSSNKTQGLLTLVDHFFLENTI